LAVTHALVLEQNDVLHKIAGKGVGIRVNDDGVDNLHPEFAGRFVTESSCTIFRPVSLQEKHGHGTSVASLALGSGNDGGCGVGIAPGASVSGCRVVLTEVDEVLAPESEDDAYLYLKMDGMGISQNSYGTRICSGLDGSDAVRRRKLQSTTCPFASSVLCGTCSAVDWSNPQPNTVCEKSIMDYCNNGARYQADAAACSSFLDLFVKCEYNALDPSTSVSLEQGIRSGRDGKGIIYVFASGNDYYKGADTNFEGTLVSRYVISVGATGRDGLQAMYSTGGAALFVSAPGGDLDTYTNQFAAAPGGECRAISPGTSFSSPLVSGVVALMLEANPGLTWRDVQGILASTSRRVDSNDKSWIVNGVGRHHSYLYGFGVVDAGAAVKAAKSWQLYSAERQIMVDSGTIALTIPDFPSDTVTSAVTVTNSDFIVESANVYLSLVHASRGDLDIVLVSPNGTESLIHPGARPENSQIEGKWKLMTVRAWGENADGVWSLRLVDRKAGNLADCVDSAGWVFDFVGAELTCGSLEKLQVCGNGGEGDKFSYFFGSTVSLSDSRLANSDGITPGEACCACGGGVAATSVKNVLQSWHLVLYGRTIGDAAPGRATPAPIITVPGPSPQLTTAVQPNNAPVSAATLPTPPVVTVPTAVTLPTNLSPTILTQPASPNLSPNGLDDRVSGGTSPTHWRLSVVLLVAVCCAAIL
jgi:subtilisin family serine protease